MTGIRKRRKTVHDLPAEFIAPYPSDADADRLWRHYLAEPSTRNRDALVRLHLPFAFCVAMTLRRRPGAARYPVGEVLSDCCVALVTAVEVYPEYGYTTPALFRTFASRLMKREVFHSLERDTWGAQTVRQRRSCSVRKFRAEFARTRGRLPTDAEIEQHVATLITNPNMFIGGGPQMVALSDLADDAAARRAASAVHRLPDPTARPAADALADREAAALAVAGLDKRERAVLALVLDGVSRKEIARRLGVPKRTAHRLIDGLLWRARCAAELADPGPVERDRCPSLKPAREPRRCEECDRPFEPKTRASRCCSDSCTARYWRRVYAERARAACG